MLKRFTYDAQQAVRTAKREARRLGHRAVDTEHLLLGILAREETGAAQVLDAWGVTLPVAGNQVQEMAGRGERRRGGGVTLTTGAKRVMDASLQEAHRLGFSYIGTDHLLLAMIGEGGGLACQVLEALGADLDQIRDALDPTGPA